MKIYNETEVQNRFDACLDESLEEPIGIQKKDKIISVILSAEEYERLSALDDAYWGARAVLAEKEGYIGPEATMAYLAEKLNEISKS